MTVEQGAWTLSVSPLCDHDRMAGGRTDAHLEADRGEVLAEMLGCLDAIIGIRGIGGDRPNAQQAEQPIQAVVEVLVDPIEDPVEHAHWSVRALLGLVVVAIETGGRKAPGYSGGERCFPTAVSPQGMEAFPVERSR